MKRQINLLASIFLLLVLSLSACAPAMSSQVANDGRNSAPSQPEMEMR